MEIKLNVPYRSQGDPDAKFATSDCGAACVAMLLDAFGNYVKIDDVFKATHKPHNEFLSRADMIKAAGDFQLVLRRYNIGNKDFLIRSIDNGKPFIALVHYEAWSKPGSGVTTQSDYKSAHFVVVTGYDGNDVFIHDPLYWGVQRSEGEHKRMTYTQFAAAWGTAHKFPGNPDFAGLIPQQSVAGQVIPVVPAVSEDVINRILAWAFISKLDVNAETLTQQEVVDVFLNFMNNWGDNVVNHVVLAGEDLGLLALRYYQDPLKWKVITLFNGLPPINAVKVGDVLRIPEPTGQ